MSRTRGCLFAQNIADVAQLILYLLAQTENLFNLETSIFVAICYPIMQTIDKRRCRDYNKKIAALLAAA